MLLQPVDELHLPAIQLGQEGVHVLRLEVQLPAVVGERDLLGVEKSLPGVQGLQGDAPAEGHIGAEICHDLSSQQAAVKGFGAFHIGDGQ